MTQRFQAMEVPIGQLVVSPINVRRDVGDVSELADSIREQGILEPLVVREKDSQYEVIIGSRRLAASQQAGLSVIPVVVQDISDADAIVRSLTENLQRGDLSLEERVEAYKQLQNIDSDRFGDTRGLARAVGRNYQTITRDLDAYDALIRLRPRGIDILHNITPSAPQRRAGEAIPESHATLLEQAMTSVRGKISPDQTDNIYAELAKTITPLESDRARRVLDYFKMYPERSVSEIESLALASVERSITLPATTARQLEEIGLEEGESN